jgi:hypothetical protein
MYLFLTYIYCVESVDLAVDCRLSRSVAMISSGSVCLVKMLRRDSPVFLHKHDDFLHTISHDRSFAIIASRLCQFFCSKLFYK